jgi:tetratricopeptide (TPR) repeat protein
VTRACDPSACITLISRPTSLGSREAGCRLDQGESEGSHGRTYLAERSLAEQKYDQAVQQYRQMQEIAPKNPMVLNNLAWALGKLNDKSAVQIAQQAVALAPNSPVGTRYPRHAAV